MRLKPIITIPLTLPLLFLYSCSKDGENARAALVEIFTVDGNIDKYLSQNTEAYFAGLADAVMDGNARKAKMVGDQYDCPYTTLETFYAMGDWSEEDSTSVAMDGSMINFYLRLVGAGVYAKSRGHSLTVSDNVSVSGKVARVEVYVPMGVDNNTKIATNYTLVKEGNAWKLDLASTFEVNELLSKQLHRRQRGSIFDFAQTMVDSPPEEIRVQYRLQ